MYINDTTPIYYPPGKKNIYPKPGTFEDDYPFPKVVYGFVPWRVFTSSVSVLFALTKSSFWKLGGHLLKLPETNSSHPNTHGAFSVAMSMFVFGEEFFFFS